MRSTVTDKITSVSFDNDIIIITTDKGKYQWKISDVSQCIKHLKLIETFLRSHLQVMEFIGQVLMKTFQLAD